MSYLDNVLSGALEISVDGVDLSRRKKLALNSGDNVELTYAEAAEQVSIVVSSTATGSGSGNHTARTVVLNNVNTSAFTVLNDGVTHVQGDTVLLIGQTTASQNGLWTVGAVVAGSAPLAAGAATNLGDLISIQGGTFRGKIFQHVESTEFELTSEDSVAIGTNGIVVELVPDFVGGTAKRIVLRGGPISLAAGASGYPIVFTPGSQGFTAGYSYLVADVFTRWTGPVFEKALQRCMFDNGAPPTGLTSLPTLFETASGAGTGYLTSVWEIDGNTVRLKVTNTHGSLTCTGWAVAEGMAYIP